VTAKSKAKPPTKRAGKYSKWEQPEAEDWLNPLGKRLLLLLRLSGLGPSEFSDRVEGKPGNLQVHLGRLASGSDTSIKLDTAVAYADKCGVDLVWLATGRGDPPKRLAPAFLKGADRVAALDDAGEEELKRLNARGGRKENE
jgi:hypothetical protein